MEQSRLLYRYDRGRFPNGLNRLKEICPQCKSGKNLIWDEMKYRLKVERSKFRCHTEEIIAKRVANGEPHPYPIRDKKGQKKGIFFDYITQNTVAPTTEQKADPFFYPVNPDDLVVCKCMLKSHKLGYHQSKPLGKASYMLENDMKEGREQDFYDTPLNAMHQQDKLDDFKAAGESIRKYKGNAEV
ncbi:unnamed protein product [Orchesella dallaii]|uniref:Uncharacterized protein n=1 Tax=Orchesella dallaii TaxID=48710 RepID=A0ABP1QI53_9HEXA